MPLLANESTVRFSSPDSNSIVDLANTVFSLLSEEQRKHINKPALLTNIRYILNEMGSFEQITGTFYKHVVSTNRDDDLKDIIAIELNKPRTNNIIDSNMIELGSHYQDGFYAFLGFPGTKNGSKYKENEIKNRPYAYYDRSIKAEDINVFSYEDSLNILIRYQHKKTITNGIGPNIGTKMKGISGGPVFWISSMSDLSNWTNERIKLSGIVFHTVERHQYMVAIRIKVLIECLEHMEECPEFNSFQVTYKSL